MFLGSIWEPATSLCMDYKYCIKRHIMPSQHCFSCKISPVYSLYSLKHLYLDNRCGKVRESASVYLISIFCNCSTLNRLS